MKYKIRFFLSNGKDMDEQFCFATVNSKHVPGVGSRVYIGDETIVDEEVKTGSIFKVKERVFVYNNEGTEDDLTSVEISVARIL